MFNTWKQEKATASLVDEAQALSDKLATAKPHILESHAAAALFWAAAYLADGQNLHELTLWKPAAVTRFILTAQTRIAALRKKREYDSSDGLAIWLHTARAVAEPRIAPVVREIWQLILNAGPNADAMAQDQMQEAGISAQDGRRAPRGLWRRHPNITFHLTQPDYGLRGGLMPCLSCFRAPGERNIGTASKSGNRILSCAE